MSLREGAFEALSGNHPSHTAADDDDANMLKSLILFALFGDPMIDFPWPRAENLQCERNGFGGKRNWRWVMLWKLSCKPIPQDLIESNLLSEDKALRWKKMGGFGGKEVRWLIEVTLEDAERAVIRGELTQYCPLDFYYICSNSNWPFCAPANSSSITMEGIAELPLIPRQKIICHLLPGG